MERILEAQRKGADFSTLLHLLAQHLSLNGKEWAKVADTASEYVSYCSNPCLLQKCRDPLDWTMLLFFVLNNSTSTYEDGRRNVPALEMVKEILKNGPSKHPKDLDSYDIFACLTALLYGSITRIGLEKVLPSMIEAFDYFHGRMAKQFLSGKRPDTTLQDYIELRRTTIATFWWRDILVSFLGIPVNFDQRTTDAIADAVWLGNDIRSLHRDESNVLDFISEADLLQRLINAYDDLEESFKTLPPLHREVICLIVVGTSAIYPAMDKYGGSRYACESDLAKDAQQIQIKRGLRLIDQAPALKDLPLISDALREWCKPLDSQSRCMQRNKCFQIDTCAIGFSQNLDVFSSVCRVDLRTGRIMHGSLTDQLISAACVLWEIKHSPVLKSYMGACEGIEKRIQSFEPTVLEVKSEISSNDQLRLYVALSRAMPERYSGVLENLVFDNSLGCAIDTLTLCDAIGVLLEVGKNLDIMRVSHLLSHIQATLRTYEIAYTTRPSSWDQEFAYWGQAGAIARLLSSVGNEAFGGVLEETRACLKRSVMSVLEDGTHPSISQGSFHMIVNIAITKLSLGLPCIREVVCLNGVLSTSRMVCEPICELMLEERNSKACGETQRYAIVSPVLTSLMAYAVIEKATASIV